MVSSSRIVIAGEIYSTNLGDGIIADSMRFMFEQGMPEYQTRLLDISGRAEPPAAEARSAAADSDFGTRGSTFDSADQVKNFVKWALVRRKRCQSMWASALTADDVLVIGGGQLLMDNGLDFPLKIDGLVDQASSMGTAVHFSACGVGSKWGQMARRLFDRALHEASTITVRDTGSSEQLYRHLGFYPTAVTGDPAVWSEQVYGRSPDHSGKNSPIGLGLMGMGTINKRRTEQEQLSEAYLLKFWQDIAQRLCAEGYAVELFTNGDPADQAYAQSVQSYLAENGLIIPLVPRPYTPQALAHLISRYRGIVAFRLHATIVAFSYGIPSVGLVWNEKVREFYTGTGKADYCLALDNLHGETTYELLAAALQEGVDAALIAANRQLALNNVSVVRRSIECA